MSVGGATLIINASNWSTSSEYFIKSIDVVPSSANAVCVLHDKHGNEIFRATISSADTRNYVLNKWVEGIVVDTWTNMTQATVHI
jgi:hypothetical protein